MKILAIDTCSRSCSVAVTDSGHLAGEVTTLRRQTHSRHLMRMVDMTLEISGASIEDIDAFAVTRGPGSFTGLRIGISTVKGLALAAEKPVVGVSSLQALAWPMAVSDGLVCALLDAGKGEVYCACYRFTNGQLSPQRASGFIPASGNASSGGFLHAESVLPPQELLANITGPCTFVGDGARAYAGMITARLGELARLPSGGHHVIRASWVARLAFLRLNREAADDIDDFIPRYIRKSDAELRLGLKKQLHA